MNPDLMMQAPAMVSAQTRSVVNQSSAQDRHPNSNQQMVMSRSIYIQSVPDTYTPDAIPGFIRTAGTTPSNIQYMQQIPILLQQPNYTIYTSQVATTNRVLTPTADFSETEVNTENDNYDRLPWQEFSWRVKKRTCARTTEVRTMKKE